MFRLSTRGRYALRAMVDLAQHASSEPVGRQELADRQEISADYVAQLFRHLVAQGLVDGVKGPGGGYRLARDPAKISAGDVLRAVEGPVAVVDCVLTGEAMPAPCNRTEQCITHLLWKRVSDAIEEELDAVTLAELSQQMQLLLANEGQQEQQTPAGVLS